MVQYPWPEQLCSTPGHPFSSHTGPGEGVRERIKSCFSIITGMNNGSIRHYSIQRQILIVNIWRLNLNNNNNSEILIKQHPLVYTRVWRTVQKKKRGKRRRKRPGQHNSRHNLHSLPPSSHTHTHMHTQTYAHKHTTASQIMWFREKGGGSSGLAVSQVNDQNIKIWRYAWNYMCSYGSPKSRLRVLLVSLEFVETWVKHLLLFWLWVMPVK